MIYRERLVVADSIVKNFEPNQIEKFLLLRKKQGK